MISRLRHIFIDPFIILLLMVMIAWLLYLADHTTAFNITSSLSLVWVLIISTPLVPNLLLKRLETQYQPLQERQISDLKAPAELLVLGGGHKNDRLLPALSRLSPTSLSRLTEAIRITKVAANSKIVLSGAHSGGKTTQADMFTMAAVELGIEEKLLVKLGDPVTTWEELQAYHKRVSSWNGGNTERPKTLVLVTSAAHMPRAMQMAAYLLPKELNIIAAPTDFRIKMDKDKKFGLSNVLPSLENMMNMREAIKEYVGIAAFYLILKR